MRKSARRDGERGEVARSKRGGSRYKAKEVQEDERQQGCGLSGSVRSADRTEPYVQLVLSGHSCKLAERPKTTLILCENDLTPVWTIRPHPPPDDQSSKDRIARHTDQV